MDPVSTARYGMITAENQITASASRIAQMTVPGHEVDLGQEFAGQIEAKEQFTASAQVVQFSGEMWRSLIEALHG